MTDLLTTKEMADLLCLNENKVYQWVEESALHQERIAGKCLSPKGHIVRWIDDSGSCWEEGLR